MFLDRNFQDRIARVEEQALTLLSLLTIDDLKAKQQETARR